MRLHPELHPHPDGNLPGVPFPAAVQLGPVSVTIAVQVGFHAVVDVLGEADLVQPQRNRAPDGAVHRVFGIVAENCM